MEEGKKLVCVVILCNSVLQATNEVVTRVPKATQAEMEAAVASSKEAFRTWSNTTVLTRQQLMLNYQRLIKRDLVSGRSRECQPGRLYIVVTIYVCSINPDYEMRG